LASRYGRRDVDASGVCGRYLFAFHTLLIAGAGVLVKGPPKREVP
jgi:hypothetical protein